MRKYIVVLLTVLILLTAATVAQAAPQVVLNNNYLAFDVPPTIENGRTLVPLRTIFEALGADVKWDGNTQTVTATNSGTEIKLVIGGQAYKNGNPVNLDVPAKITEGRTLVPLRFVSEAMGCTVGWDGASQVITISSAESTGAEPPSFAAEVHFIDVGQADAIYIELPDRNDILIDAGNKADGPTVVNYLKNEGVDDIELLIATHPHEDHIGGIPAVLDAFKIEEIIDSGKSADSDIFDEYAAKAKAEGSTWQADNHQAYTFGNTALQILTGPETWEDLNDYSVVCRLDTGDVEMLFTGDAEGPAEAALSGQLDADILKVGHHGSLTSSASTFLARVKPEVAIISVGTNNRYKHPAEETLQRIKNAGAEIYRTDYNGNIDIVTDGKTYEVKASRRGPIETSTPPILTLPEVQPVTPQPEPQVQTVPEQPQEPMAEGQYVGSSESDKYHYPSCRYAEKISAENRVWFKDEAAAQAAGYIPCGVCKP